MASPNLSEVATTSLRNRTKKLADNVMNNNALLYRLRERGNVRPFDGGRTILEELYYAENSTYTRYSGYDVLDITPQDVITAAEYDIKQVAVSVSMSGLEMIQNSGSERVIDWLGARVDNTETSMMNGMSDDCYSAGTASAGKQIGGLQLLVGDTPTSGTIGGIVANTWPFWQNISFDATTDGGAPVSAANIQSYMNRVAVQLVRGKDRPDLIIADNNYYRAYLESLQAIQRITSDTMAKAGFTSLKYLGAGGDSDVVLDGGIGGGCPTNHMYFLNTKYLALRPFSGRDMEVIGDDRYSVNQDAMVRIVGWAGNMTTRGRKFQGVLKD
jgi:hypothetical protein